MVNAADLSEAIVLYLKNYPGKNDDEFHERFGDASSREAVRAVLDETMKIEIDWAGKSLIGIGDEVERVMRERHPDLSAEACRRLANYFTYLMK